ncbi:hypothetical protein JNM87_00510 [Candidatus Saccharibacteria bacterium]|nr:hypothetical protein [Candidatus Saccharibacteria bacterium]
MISAETEATLRRLLSEQPTYQPIASIRDQLTDVSFMAFVGASCVGKTTLMDALVDFDSKYGKTRNFTSRQPRPDDDPNRYYYYDHSDEGLRALLDRIAHHENLQYNINPFSYYVYGSEIEDYPHRHNMGDILYSSIDGFRQLGFGELRVFTVICNPSAWEQRFNERFPAGNPQRLSRLQEAAASLEWSLAQTSDDHTWVINIPSRIELAVTAVDRTVENNTIALQPKAQQLAKDCLQRVKSYLL